MSDDNLERCDVLEDELRRELVDIVALVDGDRRDWTVRGPMKNDPTEVYDVDPADETGPVVFVCRSDGARFLVEVDVTVTPERKARLGLTPDGGWES